MRQTSITAAILILVAACGADDFVAPDDAVVYEDMDFVVDWPRLYDDGFEVGAFGITRYWYELGWSGDNYDASRSVASGDVILDGSFVIRGQVECWQDPRYHRDTEYVLRVRGNYPGRTDCVATFEPIHDCPSGIHTWTTVDEFSQGDGCTPPT